MKISWFSAGITSAVATKIALDTYDDVEIFYIHITSQHQDNSRFIAECEEWFDKKINIVSNSKGYGNQFDVAEKTKFINGPGGARCTKELKIKTRLEVEKKYKPDNQIFGFDFSKNEINRAIRFKQQWPDTNPLFPLIENDPGLNKEECHGLIRMAGIKQPVMYDLGFPNNNCIGCFKANNRPYWAMIYRNFPDYFERMAKLERKIGATVMKEDVPEYRNEKGNLVKSKRVWLDELDVNKYKDMTPIVSDCGMFCQTEFEHIIDKRVERILQGKEKL